MLSETISMVYDYLLLTETECSFYVGRNWVSSCFYSFAVATGVYVMIYGKYASTNHSFSLSRLRSPCQDIIFGILEVINHTKS